MVVVAEIGDDVSFKGVHDVSRFDPFRVSVLIACVSEVFAKTVHKVFGEDGAVAVDMLCGSLGNTTSSIVPAGEFDTP